MFDSEFATALVALLGGIAIVLFAMYNRVKLRELRFRERLAMIERGIIPPDERDEVHDMLRTAAVHARRSRVGSFGVVLVAVGLGLMLIIGFAGGAPGAGVGVGGAVVVLGLAFLVNAQLFGREDRPAQGGDMIPPLSQGAAPRVEAPSATIPPDEQRPTLP